MWKFLNPENKLGTIIINLTNLFLLSVMWLFLSLTILGFGPATVALYYTIVKFIRRERGTLFHEFFHAFGESWKLSLVIGVLVIIFLRSFFIFDIPNMLQFFTGVQTTSLLWTLISFLKGFILMGFIVYVFPLISRFHIGFSGALTQSVILSFKYFFRSIIIYMIIFISSWLILISPLFLAIIPAIDCYIMSFFIEPILKSFTTSNHESTDSSYDLWYLE